MRHQVALDLVRRLALREPQPVGDAEDVGVDGDGRLDAQLVQHHAGGLAPDAGQRLQRLALQRNLAAVLLDQDAREGDDVLGLGPEEADRGDEGDQARLAERHHLRRRVGDRVELLGRLVHRLVGGLRRQHHRHQQGEGRLVGQLGARIGGGRLEAAEDLRDPRLLAPATPAVRRGFFARPSAASQRMYRDRSAFLDELAHRSPDVVAVDDQRSRRSGRRR